MYQTGFKIYSRRNICCVRHCVKSAIDIIFNPHTMRFFFSTADKLNYTHSKNGAGNGTQVCMFPEPTHIVKKGPGQL